MHHLKEHLIVLPPLSKTDFRKDLEKFNIPTLIIHGDSDATVPYEYSKLTHEAIPNSKSNVNKGWYTWAKCNACQKNLMKHSYYFLKD